VTSLNEDDAAALLSWLRGDEPKEAG
jgi:hypothetical protein